MCHITLTSARHQDLAVSQHTDIRKRKKEKEKKQKTRKKKKRKKEEKN